MPNPWPYKETYIGDGVYASFDGYQLWLRTSAQEPLHEIALEPAVFTAMIAYVNKEVKPHPEKEPP